MNEQELIDYHARYGEYPEWWYEQQEEKCTGFLVQSFDFIERAASNESVWADKPQSMEHSRTMALISIADSLASIADSLKQMYRRERNLPEGW